MTSKLAQEKNSKKNFKSCFKFVFMTKNSRKETNVTFLKRFFNAMIRNTKIHKILDIIEISKNLQPNRCTHLKQFMKIFI